MKKPTIIVSADTINYYDCIAYPVVSLVCQYFGL